MTKRCVIVIPDAGPFNSLWVARRLDLLTALRMPVVVVDAVYDEMTSDPATYPKDHDVKALIDGNPTVFRIERTVTGQHERERRAAGEPRRRNAGEVAITDFLSDGLDSYTLSGDPVLLLFEDSDLRNVHLFRKPPHVHLLSTVALLHGLEKVGLIESARDIIQAMTTPPDARHARRFTDLPAGIDEPAVIGSTWQP